LLAARIRLRSFHCPPGARPLESSISAPSTLTRRFPLSLILALSGAREASAAVFLPTGEFRVAVEDLRIKVRNGEVVFARSWKADDLNRGEFRSHPNTIWDDLRF